MSFFILKNGTYTVLYDSAKTKCLGKSDYSVKAKNSHNQPDCSILWSSVSLEMNQSIP